MVTKKVFQKFFKNPDPIKYKSYFKASKKFNIENHVHFLSQLAHESCFLKRKKESHCYSLKRIRQVFPKYFVGISDKLIKEKYERKTNLLDRVYASRMGNGKEHTGDGSKYRGRGYIQLTGFNNYNKYGFQIWPNKLLEEDANWEVCFKFWINNKIDDLCCDSNFKTVKKVTKKINGGYNGLEDRIKLFNLLRSFSYSDYSF